MERTLIVLKPDAVQRGLMGEIIGRFEKIGLKIVAAKMLIPSEELVDAHYPEDREGFVESLGANTLRSYEESGIDPVEKFGHDDPKEIGKSVHSWLKDYMRSGPVFAFVIEGPHAIEIVRKYVGATLPQKAQPGTIRGDYSFDSASFANSKGRPIKNLVHASGNQEEADFEIPLWFNDEELFEYDTIHQKFMK